MCIQYQELSLAPTYILSSCILLSVQHFQVVIDIPILQMRKLKA